MSRLSARLNRERNARLVAEAVAKALRESECVPMKEAIASAGGDKDTLRGIPVMAPGVGGAMRGTRPHADHGCDGWEGR